MKCVGITYLGKVESETTPTDGWWKLSEAYEVIVQYEKLTDGLAQHSFLLLPGTNVEPCPMEVRPQAIIWASKMGEANRAKTDQLLAAMRKQVIEMRAQRSGITLEKAIPNGLDMGRGKRG